MKSATIEAPTPALISHVFDEKGYCLEPEVVPIAVPKGCTCELRLAQDGGGGWHVGYRLTTSQGDELDAFPQIDSDVKADRASALLAAATAARDWFAASPKSKLHKKCAGAVGSFIISLEGSPANKAPSNLAAQIPEPRNLDVEVEGIEPNPHNPRGEISAASVDELAQAIAAVGLLQPVGIRLIADPSALPGVGATRRELLWGHRRLAAFQKLKRATIPARVYEGISDDQARLLLLIENGQREDLDPIQAARGYQEMMRDFELTQDDIAKSVKKSRPVIANALRLLELPPAAQELIASGALTNAHGTALCRFKAWPAACVAIAKACAKERLPSSAIEKELGDEIHEALMDGKVAEYIQSWQVNGRLPDKFKDDPDFLKNGYGWFCFAPEKWRTFKAERDAAEKEAQAKQRKQTASAKTVDKGEVMDREDLWLADVLPPDKVGKKGGKLVCTDSRLWSNLRNEVRSYARSADIKHLTQLANDGIEAIKKAKSVPSAWLAIVAADSTTDYSGYHDGFNKTCKALGLQPSGKETYDRAAGLKADELTKVIVVMRLRYFAEDPDYCDMDTLGQILCGGLGLEKVGFLEETPEGRAEIATAMRKKFKWEAPAAGDASAPAKAKKGAKKK
jgi:ParB/RepB/Spo0J family partition protein